MARQRAREMLAAAAEPAAEFLLYLLDGFFANTCDVCGHAKGDPMPVLRAAQMVLDRTGFHPTVAVQAAPRDEYEPWVQYLTDAELAQIDALAKAAEERMRLDNQPSLRQVAALPAAPVDAVDAVVLDDEPGGPDDMGAPLGGMNHEDGK